MDPSRLDAILLRTLDDGRLSRAERSALEQLLDDAEPDDRELALYRSRLFALAAERMPGTEARQLLRWCEDVVKTLHRPRQRTPGPRKDTCFAAFSPGDSCARHIIRLIEATTRALDVCVFTITDDRISAAVAAAHRRGVAVRIVTDDDKSQDRGSDVETLARAGVPVALDRSPFHMHHKFALFDRQLVLTGSYNWTRGAARDNVENIAVLSDERLVKAFAEQFEQLWRSLAPPV